MFDLDKYVKVGEVLQIARENDMFDCQLAGLSELKEVLAKTPAADIVKDKPKTKCPFCGYTVERIRETSNGFCVCGAKYYPADKIWLNRKTGETHKEVD